MMEKQLDWDVYLVEVLRGEVASREAEIEALRASLRFKVGGWVLEAFPPSRQTIALPVRLLRLFLRRRNPQLLQHTASEAAPFSAEMSSASTIVLGRNIPHPLEQENANIWHTQDETLVARRLDMKGSVPGLLVLRGLSEQILRRLERARQTGWRVIWHPEAEPAALDPALEAYIRAHVDEIRDFERGIA